MSSVSIEQVGPIESLEIPVPDEGGVVVLRGANGSGKSIALQTTQRLLGGKAAPHASDGADRGTVDGFGARLKIANRISKSGTLEVASLEGSLDLAALVDPGIADPAAADAKRIKALLALTDAQADRSLFTPELMPEAVFDALGVEPSDDLVEYAGRVKRKLEAGARTHEKAAENRRSQAQGMVDEEGYGAAVERDASVLQRELEEAIQRRTELEARAELMANRQAQQQQARDKLAAMAEPDVDTAQAKAETARDLLLEAQAQLKRAKEAFEGASSAATTAEQYLKDQQQLAAHRADVEALLAEPCEPIDAEDIEAAIAGVAAARAASDLGVKAREYDQRKTRALSLKDEAKEIQRKADTHRDAAQAIDTVLSGAVADLEVGLFVENGRLCVKTSRGATPVGELSHGERWKLALDLGVRRVGRGGVLAIPQEAFEALDPTNRDIVNEHACQLGVVVLTAEAADGELRAETLPAAS